jgi:hypothetical protein
VKTFQCRESVEQLRRILGATRDELHDAQDKHLAEATKLQRPIDPSITTGMMVFLDKQDLPITYANVNPGRHKLGHHYIGQYKTLRIRMKGIDQGLANETTISNTVNVSRLKVDSTQNARIAWWPPPPQVWSSCLGTCHNVQSI